MYVKYFFIFVLSQLCGEGHGTTFNINCDPQSVPSECTSDTLDTIAAKVSNMANASVVINIEISTLQLNSNISFAAIDSLTIIGDPNITEINCNRSADSSAGFVLSDIKKKISLKYLKLSFCGSQTISDFNGRIYSAALLMLRCQNVEIHKLHIEKSRGIGLSIIYPQGSEVNITASNFTQNQLSSEYADSESVWGGGGLYIVITQDDQRLNTTFHINKCTFENNTSHVLKENLDFTDALGKEVRGYGEGGGVFVSTNGTTSGFHVTLTFSNCLFLDNKAYFGAGLSVTQTMTTKQSDYDKHSKSTLALKIIHSRFKHNGCYNKTHTAAQFGGGICFYSRTTNSSLLQNRSESIYTIKNVSFIENCANVGGAIRYHSYCSNNRYKNTLLHHMKLIACNFSQNQAHFGSAIDISPKPLWSLSDSWIVFINCKFMRNTIFVSQLNSNVKQKSYGLGTIFSGKQLIHFEGRNTFNHNYGSAIYAIDTLVNFTESSVRFFNNTGINGGALVLLGESVTIFGSKEYEFINNTALSQGGAVYVKLIDNIRFMNEKSKACFFQYNEDSDDSHFSMSWNASIIFAGNRAIDGTSGHSIYASSLHPCQVINNGTEDDPNYHEVNISEVFTVRGIRFSDDKKWPQIATDADLFHTSIPAPLKIIPGEKFKHGVTLTDELNQRVNATLRVNIVKKSTDVHLISGTSQYIGNELQLRGKPDEKAKLFMQMGDVLTAKQRYITLDIVLLHCPLGFKLNETMICVCNTDAYVGFYKCEADNFRIYLHPGIWAGFLSQDTEKLVTATCPFCDHHLDKSNFEFGVALPRNRQNWSKIICGQMRRGVLCGRCREGYTVHFHSPGYLCKPAEPHGCKLGWIYYIISEMVPVTILFTTVLIFNISFTSGAVNGFILFCQLLNTWSINAHGIIVLPNTMIYNWIQGYQIIYGFFNIDFFTSESLSFCLWKDASALDVLSVKYITILYSIVLILVVICATNNCGSNWPCRYCRITIVRTSVIHGISTFLVMCYAQCIKVSLLLLTPAYFFSEKNTNSYPPHVWLNGEMVYFSKEHLPYALPAVFCLLVVGLLPPILLLGYPLLNKLITLCGCENTRLVVVVSRYFPTSNLKPLLDSIQGSFKDNMRCFAGLYFLYRWAILLIHMRVDNFSIYYVTVGCFLLFALTLHAISQPYIKRAHNILDTLAIANLVLINFLSYYNYQKSRGKVEATVSPSVVQLTLIYFPLVIMGIYIILMLSRKCDWQTLMFRVSALIIPQRAERLRQIVQNFSSNDEDSDTNWEEFIHDRLLGDASSYAKYSANKT